MTTIAILGLGEAGSRYARGLADAGAEVRGYDPHAAMTGAGIARCDRLDDALRGADVVLSLVWARNAVAVAEEAMTHLHTGAVYADLNTAAPQTKIEVSDIARSAGVRMADVAVLAPVPRAGHRTDLLASGPGADVLAERLRPLGVPIDIVAGEVGEAARLKLLRSVFMKGLATLVIEGLEAARATGAEAWMRQQIAAELGPGGHTMIDHLLAGTYLHSERREHEVRDALATLEGVDAAADMTRATLAWFERLNGLRS
jgi:3-hydroxyisobutyrate dehydrogenase-like beta-hydroxyacid dehydrogenase